MFRNTYDSIYRRKNTRRFPFSTGGERATKYPIQQYLEIGLGVLKFSPKVFWDLSITEFMSALNGHHLKNGKSKTNNNPLVKNEMEDLMRQFPD